MLKKHLWKENLEKHNKRRNQMYKKEEYILKKSIGEEIFDLFCKYNCLIAGGAITSIFSGNIIKDYDVYFHDKESLEKLKKHMISLSENQMNPKIGKVIISITTPNSFNFSVGNKIFQLILLDDLIQTDTKKIIEQFDFTVCMGAYDFQTNSFVFDKDFFNHLSQRSLVYNINSQYPFASLYRVIKYIKKGFKISGIEMIKLGLKCNNIKINNYQELRKQLLGIDTLFLKDLTDKFNSSEMAEKEYDFNYFLGLMDDYLSKISEFNMNE
jgi:hypothetical protein